SPEEFSGAFPYIRAYQNKFQVVPGTWGTFTYDSVRLLFSAVRAAGGWNADRVRSQLSETTNYRGLTGKIDIDPKTGDRKVVPVVILRIGNLGNYFVDERWAKFAGFHCQQPCTPPPHGKLPNE